MQGIIRKIAPLHTRSLLPVARDTARTGRSAVQGWIKMVAIARTGSGWL